MSNEIRVKKKNDGKKITPNTRHRSWAMTTRTFQIYVCFLVAKAKV